MFSAAINFPPTLASRSTMKTSQRPIPWWVSSQPFRLLVISRHLNPSQLGSFQDYKKKFQHPPVNVVTKILRQSGGQAWSMAPLGLSSSSPVRCHGAGFDWQSSSSICPNSCHPERWQNIQNIWLLKSSYRYHDLYMIFQCVFRMCIDLFRKCCGTVECLNIWSLKIQWAENLTNVPQKETVGLSYSGSIQASIELTRLGVFLQSPKR